MARAAAAASIVCRRIRVRGQVQGVGFRPFVHRLARDLGLAGWVRNDAEGVEIEVQGTAEGVRALTGRLRAEAPPLARIAALEVRPAAPTAARAFVIESSRAGAVATSVVPEAAVCAACLEELFDPRDRRWRYAFINCTHCGPRYTITRALPYDRPDTSMAVFRQCPACQAEYDSPENRRFHAQPNACPDCGPRLTMRAAGGAPVECADVIAEAAARIARGEILALKGLGGFHLACDARDADAVARLRARKQREEKPFAVMLANAQSARRFARIGAAEHALLASRERPVVLLEKREGCDAALPGVAPGLGHVGVLLPYTPLHTLLFHEAAGRPSGGVWLDEPQELALVMTSANPCGEPIVRDNDEALARLAGIADAFVLHDRDIVTRCDDSVMRIVAGAPRFLRRARGYTPRPIRLAREGPPVLALGGFLKNTVCLTRADEAFVSQHIGDLDNGPTCAALEEMVTRLTTLLGIEPEIVVHDLHPDFASTRVAAAFANARGLELLGVQHHHAHIAAIAAEHRVEGPLLGLALDGVGLGEDGGLWGGELLRVAGARFSRLGHLRELPLAGGDRAAREPWRMAAAALHLLGRDGEIRSRFASRRAAGAVAMMLRAGVHTPPTSSCGRWFDAAAALLGVKNETAFEGQAAMLLEAAAARHGRFEAIEDGFAIDEALVLNLLPLLGRLADEKDAERGAARFHATLAEALAQWVLGAARSTGIRRVALGGGCFLNRILSERLRARLEREAIEVLEAERVPPNDGGISLGQAWVAMQGMEDC